MNGPTPSEEAKPVSLELILQAVHEVREQVRILSDDGASLRKEHDALKRQVNGSGAPPPNDDDGTPVIPLAKKLDAVAAELKKQSSAMGLAGLAEWFASPGATAKLLRIGGALSALYAALHAAGVVK